MGELSAYNLGKLGVNVDKSAVHLEDGEFTKAQNAVPDDGADGALCKRWGLVKHASSAAAGSILGFIGAPLGPGPGVGSDDATAYYAANAAGTWVKSTDSFATSAVVTNIAAPTTTVSSVMLNGRLFYAATTTIRVFDGVKDALFSNVGETILHVDALEGLLYCSTDSGFVYEIDAVGRLRQVGTVLPSSYKPDDLIIHQNDLYVCCGKAGAVSKVYRIRVATATALTAWTDDFSTTPINAKLSGLASFLGLLYVAEDTATADQSHVYRRDTAGSYAAVETGTNTGATYAGADDLIVYQGQIYSHWDHFANANADSVIRRSTDGTTWATVLTYTPSDAGGVGMFYSTGSKLFAIGRAQTLGHYSAAGAVFTQFSIAASTLDVNFGFFKASGAGSSFGATASFVILQGASSLQIYNSSGTLSTLTLPTGITLDTARPPRFAVFDKRIVCVNTPSRPITIDAEGITRVLVPKPPVKAISIDDDGGAGALTGDYLAKQTFLIKDAAGNIIAESDFSPAMEVAFAASSDTLDAEGLNLSPEDITGSRIYRTTAGGTTYFPWIDVDGNVLTQSVSDATTDAGLSLVAAPTLGTVPNLALVAAYKGRIWGADRADVDYAVYSEAGQGYAWPNTNRIPIGQIGSDIRGITAYIPRRDALGIGRMNGLFQMTGSSNNDFRPVTLGENLSVMSQEVVRVYKDIAYFLGKDGVYSWGANGIQNLSDGKVANWFTSDDYFNRGRFQYAFATIDPTLNRYRLYLAAVGSSSEDRWVEYDIADGTWWGPHKTGAFTPTSADMTTDANSVPFPLVASSTGYLWKDQETRTDDTATAIDFDVDTKQHDGGVPNIEKAFGRLTVSGIAQPGGRMAVTPSVGKLNGPASSQALQADLTLASQTVGRVGTGEVAKLNFRENTVGRNVQILGYELPWFELGLR